MAELSLERKLTLSLSNRDCSRVYSSLSNRDYGTLRNGRTIIRKHINSEAFPVRISGKGVRLYKCKGVHIADFISCFLNIP